MIKMQSYDCIFLLPNVIVKLLFLCKRIVVRRYPTAPKKQLARKAAFSFMYTDNAALNGLITPTIIQDAANGTAIILKICMYAPKLFLN